MKVNWISVTRLRRLDNGVTSSNVSSVRSRRFPQPARGFAASCRQRQQNGELAVDAGPTASDALESLEQVARRSIPPRAGYPATKRSWPNRGKVNSAQAFAKRLNVSIDGQLEQFDYIFLRDACACPLCIDTSTRQKLFQTSDIPADITSRNLLQSPDGTVQLRWTKDVPGYSAEHSSTFTPSFLRTYSRRRNRMRSRYNDTRQVLWNRDIMTSDVRSLDFTDYMQHDSTLLEALQQLNLYGLVFLHNVPPSASSVAEIGTRIGPLRHTFYGETWDVRSVPSAKNVAYTSQHLGMHMDLLYFADPPTLQLLHCVHNTTQGGSSLFSDSFRAAAQLRLGSPTLFRALQHFPVTYHYVNDSQHYHATHPTIEMDPHPSSSASSSSTPTSSIPHDPPHRLHSVNYSPPFQAPFEINTGSDDQGARLRHYHAGIRAFARLLDSDEAVYERRMAEGECVIFHNRRVLHARRAFDTSSGRRWLRGAYLDGDAFKSRYRVLMEQERAQRAEGEREREGREWDEDGRQSDGFEHV
ncbi:MAG: hypothetical protein M1838_001719 [Thelocarpon superellum]|nr:MAG: hypothetical protein M1838_001719 [Thelocarpon superellum]